MPSSTGERGKRAGERVHALLSGWQSYLTDGVDVSSDSWAGSEVLTLLSEALGANIFVLTTARSGKVTAVSLYTPASEARSGRPVVILSHDGSHYDCVRLQCTVRSCS